MAYICRFCGEPITRDRYNLAVEGTRQDFPPDGELQRLVEIPLENVCAHCFGKVIMGYKSVVMFLENKFKDRSFTKNV
jgi:DNA-directed RNA polymerase subunit RPC12/RpoP